MSDVYDAEVWRENKDFLNSENSLNLCLAVNYDAFCMTTRSRYSVAQVYITVLNLAAPIRLLPCNVLFGPVISAADVKEGRLPSALRGFVTELNDLYNGIVMNGLRVRCRVVTITGD